MSLERVVSLAGDGVLKEGGETSIELRRYLGEIEGEQIARYVTECMASPFKDSGFVLQDLINEVGRRLGFEVEFGRYRGVRGEVGFDGLWKTYLSILILLCGKILLHFFLN